MLRHAVSWKLTDFSEAVSTSETSANFYETAWRNIPEDSHLQVNEGMKQVNNLR
jgi:hypothetical protein